MKVRQVGGPIILVGDDQSSASGLASKQQQQQQQQQAKPAIRQVPAPKSCSRHPHMWGRNAQEKYERRASVLFPGVKIDFICIFNGFSMDFIGIHRKNAMFV